MFTSFHGISENTSNDTRPELDWRRNARVIIPSKRHERVYWRGSRD